VTGLILRYAREPLLPALRENLLPVMEPLGNACLIPHFRATLLASVMEPSARVTILGILHPVQPLRHFNVMVLLLTMAHSV
jgi:hypothetical protein